MDGLALAANLILIALLLIVFAEAIRRRHSLGRYLPVGLAAAAVIVAADLFLYVVTPPEQRLVPPTFFAFALLVLIVRTLSLTAVGLWSAERLGIAALPLLQPSGDPGRAPRARIVGAGAACGIGLILYSAALFILTGPGPPGGIAMPPEVPVDAPLEGGALLVIVVALALTVLGEELTFRLGIPNYLAARFGWRGRRYWIAIVFSSGLWSAGHIGIMDPEWVKLAQIFPAGLLLGWLFRRYGFEACVIAHGVLNLAMPYVTPLVLA